MHNKIGSEFTRKVLELELKVIHIPPDQLYNYSQIEQTIKEDMEKKAINQ